LDSDFGLGYGLGFALLCLCVWATFFNMDSLLGTFVMLKSCGRIITKWCQHAPIGFRLGRGLENW